MSNSAACVMKDVDIPVKAGSTGAIHTTLPMEQLIEIVESEIREIVRYDSFEYANPQNSSHIFFGTPRLHKCQYRIFVGGISLGQITLTRGDMFDDSEINMIEGALGALIIHLNNALDFQSSLGDEALESLRIDTAVSSRN